MRPVDSKTLITLFFLLTIDLNYCNPRRGGGGTTAGAGGDNSGGDGVFDFVVFPPINGKDSCTELPPSKNEFIEFFFLIYTLDNLILSLVCVKILRIF